MAEFPPERQGFTDMTFCMMRFEVSNIFRRILYVPVGPSSCNLYFTNMTIPEKEKWISDCHQRLEKKYIKDCDLSIPLCWITATISRLIMTKMWLIVYHPHQRKDGGKSLPQETKDKLFITSLENLEYSLLIETEARTMHWSWLFRTYVQWHAIAFLLSELCVRTKGEAVERAWRALDLTAGRRWFPLRDSTPYAKGQVGCLWLPLRKLMAKARAARERELALERASQALRENGIFYSDFNEFLNQIPTDGQSHDQPCAEKLYRMLRPVIPRLGQVSDTTSPCNEGMGPIPTNVDFFMGNTPKSDSKIGLQENTSSTTEDQNTGTNDAAITKNNGTGFNAPSDPIISPSSAFNDLAERGLDVLLTDVMEGYALDGSGRNISDLDHNPMAPFRPPNFTADPLPLTQNNSTNSP